MSGSSRFLKRFQVARSFTGRSIHIGMLKDFTLNALSLMPPRLMKVTSYILFQNDGVIRLVKEDAVVDR